MKKEITSDRQKICIMILFILGTSTALVTPIDAKEDLWLSITLGILIAFFMLYIYTKLNYIFPNKDLFYILETCFGRILGKGLGLLYTWFAFHIGSIILRHNTEFFQTVSLHDTPRLASGIILSLLSIWIVKAGIEVIGRFSVFFLPVVFIFIFAAMLLLISDMDINNIYPVLYNGIKPVIKGGFSIFSFPFGEIFLLTMIFSTYNGGKSPYQIYAISLILGGITLLTTSLANLLVLGVDLISSLYFPTYQIMKQINIARFMYGVEIVSINIYIISGFIKMSVCLMAACKGISKIFDYTDYKFIVTPIAFLMLNLSYILHNSLIEMVRWTTQVWIYYSFLFQVILPIVILIVASLNNNLSTKQLK